MNEPTNRRADFERVLSAQSAETVVLRLFIAGMSPKSQRALNDVRQMCEEKFQGRYRLDVVDIYQQPELAREEQVIAVPMLVKQRPLPIRKCVGAHGRGEELSRRIGLGSQ